MTSPATGLTVTYFEAVNMSLSPSMMAKRGPFAWQACDREDELILIKS